VLPQAWRGASPARIVRSRTDANGDEPSACREYHARNAASRDEPCSATARSGRSGLFFHMKHGLNLSWVAPGLAVGGSFRPVQVEALRALSIRRVVDVRAERCDDPELLARHEIELLHLPTPDMAPLDRSSLVRGV